MIIDVLALTFIATLFFVTGIAVGLEISKCGERKDGADNEH